MSGVHVTELKLSSLKDLKDKLATGTFTNGEILALINEIEFVLGQLKESNDKIDQYAQAYETIGDLLWARMDDSVDLERLRDEVDTLRRNVVIIPPSDRLRMQKLLARILHKVETAGSIAQDDELINEVRRYIHDAGLFFYLKL